MRKPLSPNLLVPFETLINRCIKQDIKLANGIARHSGKTLQLDINSPALGVLVHFYPTSVSLTFTTDVWHQTADPSGGSASNDPDGRISASSLSMLRLLLDRNEARSLVNPAIQIHGDSEFVQSVYLLFLDMEINWQEPLSQLIGDVPTHGLEQLFKNLDAFRRSAADSLKRNVDEYLHEESRLVPPHNQLTAFDRKLDSLRLRLDRLQARIQRLDQQMLQHPETPPQ